MRDTSRCSRLILFCLLTFISYSPIVSYGQSQLINPFQSGQDAASSDKDSEDYKSAEQLVAEANVLFMEKRPLDARGKLQQAIEKEPTYYPAYMYLGEYYMVTVGHFRLSLKHIKKAQQLFEEQRGSPPYNDLLTRKEHAYLLYLLAQARLNLDDYPGALTVLDQYSGYGYYSGWYPGTRAWVMMKLGQVKEAIGVARAGLLAGAEEGRTLNMLGILLSMDNNPSEALQVFRSAVAYELSLGEDGQPATPLNNSGEVYREIFDDERAEATFRKALRLPDGCEHILPTLNLDLLLMDQLRVQDARQALDDFDGCVAQYTLRNGEEHRALAALMRGRLALASGHPLDAIPFLRQAIEGVQWFGKIGTNKDDLEAGALTSLYQSLEAAHNNIKTTLPLTLAERLEQWRNQLVNRIETWWVKRKARSILINQLNNIEDLHIRNTDSLLSYSQLGAVLRTFPPSLLTRRIDQELKYDTRNPAHTYYKLYLAESFDEYGNTKQAIQLAQEILTEARPRYDDGVVIRAKLILIRHSQPSTSEYLLRALQIYNMNHATLRNEGFPLPIRVAGAQQHDIISALAKSGFFITDQSSAPLATLSQTGSLYRIEMKIENSTPVQAEGDSVVKTVREFTDKVFSSSRMERK